MSKARRSIGAARRVVSFSEKAPEASTEVVPTSTGLSQPPIDVSDAAQQRRDALQGAEYRRQQQQEMEAEKEMLAAQYPGCVLCTRLQPFLSSRATHTH